MPLNTFEEQTAPTAVWSDVCSGTNVKYVTPSEWRGMRVRITAMVGDVYIKFGSAAPTLVVATDSDTTGTPEQLTPVDATGMPIPQDTSVTYTVPGESDDEWDQFSAIGETNARWMACIVGGG